MSKLADRLTAIQAKAERMELEIETVDNTVILSGSNWTLAINYTDDDNDLSIAECLLASLSPGPVVKRAPTYGKDERLDGNVDWYVVGKEPGPPKPGHHYELIEVPDATD